MNKNPFLYDPIKPKEPLSKIILDFLQFFVIVIAVFAVSYLFLFIPNQVDGESMLPNFVNGELLFTNKIGHMLSATELGKGLDLEYKRGDVVVFQKPGFDPFIKRVIGLPGDEVKIENGYIYINTRRIEEPYLQEGLLTESYDLGEGVTHIIQDNYYFLLGDNRMNSQDSRFNVIGQVHWEHIKGRVFLRYTKCEPATEKCSLTFDLIKHVEIDY